ncbi:hypothetical protein [Streptomyces sp. RTGN2]|uniref:hypothetical protein n=1 Tax=Streptomyces sp. RTGN2 TaxID=3016525 RepID=UPI002554E67D|nr:hypothetical protein [Streptomyces sp. RTGN2]
MSPSEFLKVGGECYAQAPGELGTAEICEAVMPSSTIQDEPTGLSRTSRPDGYKATQQRSPRPLAWGFLMERVTRIELAL